MSKFSNWIKRYTADAAITTATESGAEVLADDVALIAAAEARVERLKQLLDQAQAEVGHAVANRKTHAEQVAASLWTVINATKSEFAEEEAQFDADVQQFENDYDADIEELTARFNAAKAARLKKRDTQISARASEFNGRETEVLGELLEASKVLTAANEVIFEKS